MPQSQRLVGHFLSVEHMDYYNVIEQLIEQLVKLNEPRTNYYLKDLKYQFSVERSFNTHEYTLTILEEVK